MNTLKRILNLNSYKYIGPTPFLFHLLYSTNIQPKLTYRGAERLEQKTRELAPFHVSYQNVDIATITHLAQMHGVFIMSISNDNYDVWLPRLASIDPSKLTFVVHATHDLYATKNKPSILAKLLHNWKIITIRNEIKEWLATEHGVQSEFVTHPFYEYPKANVPKNRLACSMTRLEYTKHMEITLDANRLLKAKGLECIDIYGKINRRYEHFVLKTDFAKDENYKGVYLDVDPIARQYKFQIDLSYWTHDGGGTQYTFLQAIYADSVLILHRKWVEAKFSIFKEGYNCLAVENANELADLLAHHKRIDTEKINQNAKPILAKSTSIETRQQWERVLDV